MSGLGHEICSTLKEGPVFKEGSRHQKPGVWRVPDRPTREKAGKPQPALPPTFGFTQGHPYESARRETQASQEHSLATLVRFRLDWGSKKSEKKKATVTQFWLPPTATIAFLFCPALRSQPWSTQDNDDPDLSAATLFLIRLEHPSIWPKLQHRRTLSCVVRHCQSRGTRCRSGEFHSIESGGLFAIIANPQNPRIFSSSPIGLDLATPLPKFSPLVD